MLNDTKNKPVKNIVVLFHKNCKHMVYKVYNFFEW